ncbi:MULTISPECIES: P-type conjugative transfer protein TrbL [Roseivivax]|uniref:P-type conjugative transfer protein TrbL n=1 Tax=Roseivivax TaxID=93682 RepID=UPI0008D2BE3C|nr:MULTISPECIES: P-type conjugative transfer protein TrbL [Roseivivax]QFT46687.1 TrbL/VirB6 plasmid conjugal transfer protein [Roseivivax sp. THAF40]QFT63049.1 TrbL/VirB6 plasmid conjugal transfer protein [Roseivivax sp. THAF30]SEL39863.1 type IV secretion system protein TrbL [Roseivivax marinus]
MGGVSVIDRFLEVFASYIDSGFGLLGGDVVFLATTLIVIDITLAALFWAWGTDDDIIARLVKKTLFVGVFAYIIGNWNALARIVFDSFAGLGLVATGGTISASELLQPGRIAQVGLEAGQPILASIADLSGFVAVFENFIQIGILFFAWLVVLLSFFILAIQLFVTLIEFKLATLAGFILVPFGLFNKTAFMAERVLGLVISSGVKVLVLAVIVGIGSTIFSEFTAGFAGEPTINDAMSVVLGALALLALGIFGPGIANGIVSGGPQLGAGAAVGTGIAVGGAAVAGVAGTRIALGTGGAALRGASAVGSGTATAYQLGAASRSTALGKSVGGVAAVGKTGAVAAFSPLRRAISDGAGTGARTAYAATGGRFAGSTMPAPANDGPPDWARRMKRQQSLQHGLSTAAHALRSGDHGGGGTVVSLSERSS